MKYVIVLYLLGNPTPHPILSVAGEDMRFSTFEACEYVRTSGEKALDASSARKLREMHFISKCEPLSENS